MEKWSQLSSKVIFKCQYFTLNHDEYRLPNGNTSDYYYVHTYGSTLIIPRLPDGKLVVTRQHRYLMKALSLEFPAGGVKEGIRPEDNARLELEEECGYKTGRLTKIGQFVPYNGVASETCHVYVADELTPCPPRPEETEEIEIVTTTLDELTGWIGQGELLDGMSLAALSLYREFLKAENAS